MTTVSRSWQVRVTSSIETLGRQVWDQLETPSFYLSHDWLRAVEGMLAPEHPYLVVEDRGAVVAVAPCQLVRDPDVYAFYSPQALLLGSDRVSELQRWLSLDRASRLGGLAAALRPSSERLMPALLATAPRGHRSGISYHHSLTPWERVEIARRLVEGLDELARSHGAATVAFFYLPRASDPYLEAALAAGGYAATVLAGDCTLDLRWPDFDSYIGHFRSGHRQSLMSDIRRFVQAGCTIQLGGTELLSDDLAALQVATQSKYGHVMDPARTLRWYARIRTELAGYARVTLARRGADVLGFGLFYEAGRELYARAVGFDYARLARERSYFSLVFYEPIRYAIANRLRRIHYGIESYEAKMHRGCGLQTSLGWFRFHTPDSDRLAELLGLHTEAQLARQAALRRTYAAS